MPEAPVAPPPSAPASPATAPALSSDSAVLQQSGGSEAFADLESLATEKPDVAPPAEPEKETPRKPDGKFAKTEPKPDDKPPEKPADKPPTAKTPEEPPAEKMAPKQLREAYEALKAKHKALETEHTTLKTKTTQPADDPEKKTLSEKLAAREKRLQEIEEELKFTDYSKSEEYKEKFEKPFVDAYIAGRAKIAALKIAERTNDIGEVVQQARQATADDFDQLMKISDDDAAADWAAERFGPKASIVLYHRERAQELNQARTKAIEDYRKNGSEREKTRSQELETFRKNFTETVAQHAKTAEEKYPHWFKPDETDAKGNEILERGKHLVARVAANGAPVKDGEPPMTPQQLAAAVAAVRHKAGAFDRLAHRHSLASARIKELETKLAEFEASQPGSGDGKGAKVQHDAETPESAFDAAFK